MRRSTQACLVILTAVTLLIGLLNFPISKWFIGWDALNPELNYDINFSRVFTAFWQENQGLGLLGGHGFAAVLPHTLIAFLIDLLVPQEAVRPIFTFFMLYLGGVGVFFFCRRILELLHTHATSSTIDLASLVAGLYYMLNLGTLEMFYIQLEAFIIHFAALPWLLFVADQALHHQSKRILLGFAIVSFLFSTQGFIPPLFIAYAVALGLWLGAYVLCHPSKGNIRKVAVVIGITVCMNAYWLIPLGYYTITRSTVYLNSYNNLISTPEFVDKNRMYGGLKNVSLIKGFVFEGIETVKVEKPLFVFQPWVTHHENILVPLIGYAFFCFTLLGIVVLLRSRKMYLGLAMLLVFVFFFTGIATDVPGVNVITRVLQELPVYKQAFRAAFTKFSLGVAFSYSILIGVAASVLLYHVTKKTAQVRTKRILAAIVSTILISALLYYALPAFTGNFIFHRLVIPFPEAYLDLMRYFKTADQYARIANFPQDCAEGWTTTKWQYTGSGFYWYGLKQPMLDRAFDVWSNRNENYYWELMQILRSRSFDELDALFSKYDVKWVLFDPNVAHCRDTKGFEHEKELVDYLRRTPEFQKVKDFSSPDLLPISLFERKNYGANSFVRLARAVPNVGPEYLWNDDDTVYKKTGDYKTLQAQQFDVYLPFRSLFSKRGSRDNEFAVTETGKTIQFKALFNGVIDTPLLSLPNITQIETFVPVAIRFDRAKTDTLEVSIDYLNPSLSIDGKRLTEGIIGSEKIAEYDLKRLGIPTLVINSSQLKPHLESSEPYQTLLFTKTTNTITLLSSDGKVISTHTIDPSKLSAIYEKSEQTLALAETIYQLTIDYPKAYYASQRVDLTEQILTSKPYPCNELIPSNRNEYEVKKDDSSKPYLRLRSKRSRHCLAFPLPQQTYNTGYIVFVESRRISGRNPSFYIQNHTNHTNDLDVYLYSGANFRTYPFILPPGYTSGLGRTIYYDSYSLTGEQTVNDLSRIELFPIPYTYLKEVSIRARDAMQPASGPTQIPGVTHPNETIYQITLPESRPDGQTLILSQSFDPGWTAWDVTQARCNNPVGRYGWCGLQNDIVNAFPYFLGERLTEHVLVNNWANGWKLGEEHGASSMENRQIVILFWPQLLQYLGFALLPLPFLYALTRKTAAS